MARPRIGIFGALVAVGGLFAWRWAQRHRASQANLNRDLNRWEGEGGTVTSAAQTAPSTASSGTGGASGRPNGSANGSTFPGGSSDPWPFPHS